MKPGAAHAEEVAGLMAPPMEEHADGTPSIGSLGRIGEEQETSWRNFICRSSHPVASFFHLCFKSAALALYMCGSWFFSIDYVTTFVICILLLAFDFWTVKNITGRLLVGLRWWVRIKEDGSNEWLFESAPANRVQSALDSRIFWWTLYITPAIWGTFAALAFLRLNIDWLLIDLVALGLTGSNLVGYFKCSSDASKRLRATLTSGAMAGLSYLPSALPALGTSMLTAIGAGALSAAMAGAAGGAAAAGAAAGTGAGAAAPQLPAGAAAAGGGRAMTGDAGGRVNPFGGTSSAGAVAASSQPGRKVGGGGAVARYPTTDPNNPFGDGDADNVTI
jgi:hypothetical protein